MDDDDEAGGSGSGGSPPPTSPSATRGCLWRALLADGALHTMVKAAATQRHAEFQRHFEANGGSVCAECTVVEPRVFLGGCGGGGAATTAGVGGGQHHTAAGAAAASSSSALTSAGGSAANTTSASNPPTTATTTTAAAAAAAAAASSASAGGGGGGVGVGDRERRLLLLRRRQQQSCELHALVRKLTAESAAQGASSPALAPLCEAVTARLGAAAAEEPVAWRHAGSIGRLLNADAPFPVPGFAEAADPATGGGYRRPQERARGFAVNVFAAPAQCAHADAAGGCCAACAAAGRRFLGVFRPRRRHERLLEVAECVHALARVRRVPGVYAAQAPPPSLPADHRSKARYGVGDLRAAVVAPAATDAPGDLQALYSSTRVRAAVQAVFEEMAVREKGAAAARVPAADVVQFLLDAYGGLLPSYDAGETILMAEEDVACMAAAERAAAQEAAGGGRQQQQQQHPSSSAAPAGGVQWEEFYLSVFELALLMQPRNEPLTELALRRFMRDLRSHVAAAAAARRPADCYRAACELGRRARVSECRRRVLVPPREAQALAEGIGSGHQRGLRGGARAASAAAAAASSSAQQHQHQQRRGFGGNGDVFVELVGTMRRLVGMGDAALAAAVTDCKTHHPPGMPLCITADGEVVGGGGGGDCDGGGGGGGGSSGNSGNAGCGTTCMTAGRGGGGGGGGDDADPDNLESLLEYLAGESDVSDDALVASKEEWVERQGKLRRQKLLVGIAGTSAEDDDDGDGDGDDERAGGGSDALLDDTAEAKELRAAARARAAQARVASRIRRKVAKVLHNLPPQPQCGGGGGGSGGGGCGLVPSHPQQVEFTRRFKPSAALGAGSVALLTRRQRRIPTAATDSTTQWAILRARAAEHELALRPVGVTCRNVGAGRAAVIAHVKALQVEGRRAEGAGVLRAYEGLRSLPHAFLSAVEESRRRERAGKRARRARSAARRTRCGVWGMPPPGAGSSSEEEEECEAAAEPSPPPPQPRRVSAEVVGERRGGGGGSLGAQPAPHNRRRPLTASRLARGGVEDAARTPGCVERAILLSAQRNGGGGGRSGASPRPTRLLMLAVSRLGAKDLRVLLADPANAAYPSALARHAVVEKSEAAAVVAGLAVAVVARATVLAFAAAAAGASCQAQKTRRTVVVFPAVPGGGGGGTHGVSTQ